LRARMTLPSGTKLGPYEIQSPLGAGGMGEVYRARDTRLGRDVAVKVLPEHLSSNSDLKLRLEREAKAISSLNHPHICILHDVGSQNGMEFLVMEHLEGETLADRLHRGPLPLNEALSFAIQITGALDKAHAHGVIHRDLKPANIMLTKSGAKLMDFGLAKPAGAVSVAANAGPYTPSTPTMNIATLSADASTLTQKGTVVGTFQYMAPEVLQGTEANAQSDIFSFGCLLYEMITGRRAFEGKSQLSVLGAILDHEPERISVLNPGLPPRLDETVHRCLAKNPEQRYGCIHDVRIQLEGIAQAASQSQSPLEQPPSSSKLAWLIAAVAALIAVSIAAAYLLQAPKPASLVQSSIVPPPGTSFVTMLPSSGPPVLSPDGTRLAFTARDTKGKVLLYVRSLASSAAQPLSGTDDAMYPFWSADGRQLGFFADGKLKKIDAGGGPAQDVCDVGAARGGTWNQDGTILFTPSTTQAIMRVSAAGGTAEPVSKLDSERSENSHRWPTFLPDGKHFLYWARSSKGPHEDVIYIGELGSAKTKMLMQSDSIATYASGYLLFLRDQALMAQPFDLKRLELSGDPVLVAQQVGFNGATAHPLFTVSQTGILVYQSGNIQSGWDLLWLGRDGKPAGSFPQSDRYIGPVLSHDGKRVVVGIFTGSAGVGDLWIYDLERGTSTRLTFGPANNSRPVWSPDDKTIYYASSSKGIPHISAKAADGSGSERVILETANVVEGPASISPDGRYLAYLRKDLAKDVGTHIWVLPLFGDGKPFPILQDTWSENSAEISPDGKWMAYVSNESGRNQVYITPFPGGGAKWEVSKDGGSSPKWRGDGKELFYLDNSDSIVAVELAVSSNAIDLGVPHTLFQAVGIQRDYGPYDVTSDGKKFLINSGNIAHGGEPLMLVQDWQAAIKK
jgi:eukaryotic-like serine/threonine-protein kinase